MSAIAATLAYTTGQSYLRMIPTRSIPFERWKGKNVIHLYSFLLTSSAASSHPRKGSQVSQQTDIGLVMSKSTVTNFYLIQDSREHILSIGYTTTT